MSDSIGAPSAVAVGQTFTGTAFGDRLTGGAGDDTFIGLGGADSLNGGAGNDRFFWTAGDGADVVEGGAGLDTQFIVGGQFDLFTSGVNALVGSGEEFLTLHGVEAVQLKVAAGATALTVFDLSGSDVRQVVALLNGADAAADSVNVIGAPTEDVMTAQVLNATDLRVFDIVNDVVQTTVVSGLDGKDSLLLSGGLGDDKIAIATPNGVVTPAAVSVHGGGGADSLTGSSGAERLFGDDGNDSLSGGAGDDTIDAGIGSDVIDGGAGFDIQAIVAGPGGLFADIRNGANGHIDETLAISNRVVDSHVDAVNVEAITIQGAAGQADFISAGFFNDNSVSFVNVDFGVGGQRDFFLYGGTGHADTINVSNLNGSNDIGIGGTAFGAAVHHFDDSDGIEIDAGAGDDVIDLRNLNFGGDVLVDGDIGSDHMIAGFGRVEFVFNAGLQANDHDVIDNFKSSNPSIEHVIRLENLFDHSLSEMIAKHHIVQSGADVVLLGSAGSTLTLTHTNLASLTSSDFHFFG